MRVNENTFLGKGPGSFSTFFYAFSMHFNGKSVEKEPGPFLTPFFTLYSSGSVSETVINGAQVAII